MTYLTNCNIARLLFALSSCGTYQTRGDFLLISLGGKRGGSFCSSQIDIFRGIISLLCEEIFLIYHFFLESKNSETCRDFDINSRTVGHREVNIFCKTLFETLSVPRI